ncbi:helix-turn-helix domain-containing protein [Glutamicibacter mishrai]|uniref:helix-turn-helix domain-containing protein n=1 Tax=Glutamicibacter mishrai TaxID=1775880 RepID=UPI0015590EDE|nr:helix-turn-helix domain-containing protein [Glutamicibacter mishrai]
MSDELTCCSCHVPKKAYTVQEAAESYGVGVDTIRAHIKLGNLIARYPSSRPVIASDELRDWFNSLPEERG